MVRDEVFISPRRGEKSETTLSVSVELKCTTYSANLYREIMSRQPTGVTLRKALRSWGGNGGGPLFASQPGWQNQKQAVQHLSLQCLGEILLAKET